MRRMHVLGVVSILVLTGLAGMAPAQAATGTTIRASLTDADAEVGAPSWSGDVSDDGDVAFTSAGALAGTDANGVADVYVRSGLVTILVSRDSGTTTAGDGVSDSPAISADGELIAFRSEAALIAGDNNGVADVYLFDRDANDNNVLDDSTPTVTAISRSSAGVLGNGASDQPAISPDGRYVTFRSAARNLVTHDHNALTDVFVRDLVTTTTYRASVNAGGHEANGPSAVPSVAVDGTQLYVAFETLADNLVAPDDGNGVKDVVRWGRSGAGAITVEPVSLNALGDHANGPSGEPSLSGNGSLVAFTSDATDVAGSDTNGVSDVFVRDTVADSTERISVAGAATQANGRSDSPDFAAAGGFVAFRSWATNLGAGDTNGMRDVFVRALAVDTTTRASLTSADLQVAGRSFDPSISGDAEYVVFHSDAADVIGSDTNGALDVFRRQRDIAPPVISSLTPDVNHPTGNTNWQSATVQVTIAAGDNISGVDGYSVKWDTSAGTIPDTTKDIEETPTTITSPLLSTSTTNYLHIRALDNAGNWSGVSHLGPWKMDATPPALSASISPVHPVPGALSASIARSTTLTLSWTASDAHSGLNGYELWYKRARYDRSSPGFDASVKYKTLTTGTTSTSFTGASGYTYVIWLIAKDNAANSNSKTWKVGFALDDPAVPKTSGWTTVSGSSYYGGEASKTSASGPFMSLSVKYPQYIVALVTKCSTCGSVRWMTGGYDGYSVSLDASSTTLNVGIGYQLVSGATSVGLRSLGGGTVTVSGFGIIRAGN